MKHPHSSKSGRAPHRHASELQVHLLSPKEKNRFQQLLAQQHYLGDAKPTGDFLCQVVTRHGKWVALLVWGPAALKLADRDQWIGWHATLQLERLKLIAQNRRYLLLHERGTEPNLASQALAAATRALPEQWQQKFGYRPLLAESFTDPEAYAGTCYKASGWVPVGFSKGHRRHRADYYVPGERPKRLWCKELTPDARATLRNPSELPPDCAAAVVAAPHGVLPLKMAQQRSLLEVFTQAPEPRARNTRFRIGPVLALVALALLAGKRQFSEIARFATRLTPRQRAALRLPRKKGTKAFYEVPSYSVFYEVLTRMDPEAFAELLSGWLSRQQGLLPGVLALDGKMIRDIIGTLSVVDTEEGAPVALGVMDQKEKTERCELKVAQQVLAKLPPLLGTTVTADPLHCQKETARLIVEQGGDYFLQIKGNQPTLLAQARKQTGGGSPLLSRPAATTGAWKNGG
ncbi:MAG: ISAs1 family transposase [Verrucomicrobia bacterium]|nr:ISAs1 family transposase [Verrucomicrobiota bacterium]